MSNHALKRRPLTTAVKQNRQVWRQPSTYVVLLAHLSQFSQHPQAAVAQHYRLTTQQRRRFNKP